MANIKFILFLQLTCLYLVSCRLFLCPEISEPPEALDNTDFSLKPYNYSGVLLNQVQISNKVLINTHKYRVQSITDYFEDSDFCP